MGFCKKLRRKIRNLFRVHDLIESKADNIENKIGGKISIEQMSQVAIMNQYKMMAALMPAERLPAIRDAGFKVYSQFDEDGILLYIFSLIGFSNRKVVEISAGNGEECNTANLIINHACHGLLIDGDARLVEQAQNFFAENQATWLCPPVCRQAWITKDNVNALLEENEFSGEVDLLSLDIDGNDYWLWQAISAVSPRVMICEAHNIIPDDMAVTVPYRPDFNRQDDDNYHEDFLSASPLAMIKLSQEKGYRLIGSHKYGFNLIFMRNDTGLDLFPEVPLSSISDNPFTVMSKKTRWPAVKDAPWVKV